uniref:Uncharacterized protein n=1 Tax=Anopheles quadriannulatus TaxID=34691 RepID=A0A182XR07_ANOQN
MFFRGYRSSGSKNSPISFRMLYIPEKIFPEWFRSLLLCNGSQMLEVVPVKVVRCKRTVFNHLCRNCAKVTHSRQGRETYTFENRFLALVIRACSPRPGWKASGGRCQPLNNSPNVVHRKETGRTDQLITRNR